RIDGGLRQIFVGGGIITNHLVDVRRVKVRGTFRRLDPSAVDIVWMHLHIDLGGSNGLSTAAPTGESGPVPSWKIRSRTDLKNIWCTCRAALGCKQEVEIAALVSLQDMLDEHATIASLITRLGRSPPGPAQREFRVADFHVDAA